MSFVIALALQVWGWVFFAIGYQTDNPMFFAFAFGIFMTSIVVTIAGAAMS